MKQPHNVIEILRGVIRSLLIERKADKETIKRLEDEAGKDFLTGFNNRRNMNKIISREISRATRNSGKLSFLLLDFDNFKCINDKRGHTIGDIALKEVSRLIAVEIREIDIPFRYGGEEFLVVLPETDAAEAKFIGERLRKAIEKHPFPDKMENFNCTVSGGIAELSGAGESQEEILERADKALYKSKEEGRNRIMIAA